MLKILKYALAAAIDITGTVFGTAVMIVGIPCLFFYGIVSEQIHVFWFPIFTFLYVCMWGFAGMIWDIFKRWEATLCILLLVPCFCYGAMHQEEVSDADVTVGWYFEKLPIHFGIHVIGDTDEGKVRWIHVEGIPLLITIMEFNAGGDENEDINSDNNGNIMFWGNMGE